MVQAKLYDAISFIIYWQAAQSFNSNAYIYTPE